MKAVCSGVLCSLMLTVFSPLLSGCGSEGILSENGRNEWDFPQPARTTGSVHPKPAGSPKYHPSGGHVSPPETPPGVGVCSF